MDGFVGGAGTCACVTTVPCVSGAKGGCDTLVAVVLSTMDTRVSGSPGAHDTHVSGAVSPHNIRTAFS